ncbi:MAG: MBG domain-containing protein, partial [Verrucomicrobiota bacterium]
NISVINVTLLANLGIGKSANVGGGYAAGNVIYTISVTNNGPSVAGGVVVTDAVPAGAAFVSASVPGTNNLGVVTWAIGTLALNQITNVTLTVSLPAQAPVSGSVTNVAGAGPTNGPPVVSPPVTTGVTNLADLQVTNVAPATVIAGSTYTNVISVTNAGPSSATNVVVVDVRADGTSVTNVIAVLPAGGVTNLSVVSTAPGSGPLTNTASAGSGVYDPNLLNNTNISVINVTLLANLGIGKSSPSPVTYGTNFDYTISVTNFGPSLAANLSVTDSLPAGLVFVSASTGWTTNGSQVVWTNLGSLVSGAVTNLTLTVHPTASGTVTNYATVGSPTLDPNPTNNTSPPAVTTINKATLLITANSTNKIIGTTYVFDSTVPSPDFGVSGLVNGETVGSATLTSGGATNTAPVGTYTISVTNATGGTFNSANYNINYSNATLTVVAAADLAVAQFGPTNGVAGSNLVFTVTVTNLGPSIATNVLVTNLLSPGFTFASSPFGVNSGNAVTWLIASLPLNGVTNLTLTAFATEGGIFTNIASGGSAILDLNVTNNNGSLSNAQSVTVITSLADVVVFKTGDTNVNAGAVANYTITVSNAGPSTATSIVVQDTLPAGGTFQSATAGYSTNVTGVVTWNLPTLAPGAAATFNISLLASASVSSLLDIASATSPISDPNTNNNNGSLPSARVTTTVKPVADVQVFLYGPTNVTLGDGFSYTVVVSNGGPSSAFNTLTKDFLPTNLLFTSASGGGVLSNGAVVWPVLPVLTNGQATNFTLNVAQSAINSTNLFSFPPNPYNFIETNTSFFVGSLTNVASAFATTFDPNTNNNNGTLSTAQVRTVITPGVFSVFLATNTYPTNAVLTNTIIPIGPNLFIVGTGAWNPQTQLYEEFVTVTNIGTVPVHALRLYVGGLRSGVTLYNATGTNNGVPYVEYDPPYNSPLLPFPAFTNGSSVRFVLEFWVPDRRPFTNKLTAVAISTPTVAPLNGVPANIVQQGFVDLRNPSNVRFLLQFTSIPGRTYTVEYSDDSMVTWNIAVPSIFASTTSTFWYDDGPPTTISRPDQSSPSRFYRVILNP